ncbi:MAG TPA: hypothetical protein VMT47_08230 [Polyangia bacterium]|nr:hypothetical protein [Polyangia bacterium]
MRLDSRALVALSLVVVGLGFATRVHAQPAGAADVAPPYAPPASAPPPAADPHDAVLKRLLRSGCRDGLPEARGLAASGAVPWAETVARLCGEILQRQPTPAPRRMASRVERDGRGTMVVWSTIYGIWTGIAVDVLLTIDGARAAIIPPLLGMGAGLGLSLVLTSDHPLTNGQAWTVVTGLQYGSFNGALWAGAFDFSAKAVVGTTLATGLVSSAVALIVAQQVVPEQGDVEVVRSGLFWGTVAGMLGMLTVSANPSRTSFLRGAGVSMDLGFLAGLALAASVDVSRNRDLIIDAGTLGGGVAGLGLAWLAVAGPNASGRAIAGGGLAGMFAGMLATIYLTRDMDRDDDEPGSPVAALVGRDARGRWSMGTPGPAPVLDGLGQRIIGATFTAVGGAL